jgi:hypothetical protein
MVVYRGGYITDRSGSELSYISAIVINRTFYLYLVRPEVPRSLQTEPGAVVHDKFVLFEVRFASLLLIEYDPSMVPGITQLG